MSDINAGKPFKTRIYLKGGQVIELMALEVNTKRDMECNLTSFEWTLSDKWTSLLYVDLRQVAAIVTEEE